MRIVQLSHTVTDYFQALKPGQRNVAIFGAALGSVALGVVASGQRNSATAQAITYGGIVGVVAALPLYGAGRAALSVATRRATQSLESGTISEVQHAAELVTAKARTMAPTRRMFFGSAGVATGAIAGNHQWQQAQTSLVDAVREQQAGSAPAAKTGVAGG